MSQVRGVDLLQPPDEGLIMGPEPMGLVEDLAISNSLVSLEEA
jgi:hypothetical protein